MTGRDRFRLVARLRRWLTGPIVIGKPLPLPGRESFTLPRALAEYVLPPGVSYAHPETPWPSVDPPPWPEPEPLLPVPDPVVARHGDTMSVHWPAIRTLWWLDPRVMDGYSEPGTLPEGVTTEPREVAEIKDANLISSRLTDGFHSPVLDVDYGARLIPSSTPGHFHLYLDDLRLTWDEYQELLLVLAKLGVIEPGYAAASIDRRQTMVRKPGVTKPQPVDEVTESAPTPERGYRVDGEVRPLTPEQTEAILEDHRRRSNPDVDPFVSALMTGDVTGPLFHEASALDNWVSMETAEQAFPADTDSVTFVREDPF